MTLSVAPDHGTETLLHAMGRGARAASRVLALAPTERKRQALHVAAQRLRATAREALAANRRDMEAATAQGATAAFLDRLRLDDARLEAIAAALEAVASLPDPVGRVLAAWERPNGLRIERVATPLGVVGVIFESRPNVFADAAALCVMSGNAAILRTGTDALETALAIERAVTDGLRAAGLPEAAVQLVPTRDRAAVGAMLGGLAGAIDVIVPRGGKSLVARVQAEARVPVFAHLEGVNHVFVHAAADLDMARSVLLNSKMRRTGVCGAAETLLVDRAGADRLLAPLVTALLDAGCAVRGDGAVQVADPRVTPAQESDWGAEYLDAVISARVVEGIDGALDHIDRFGSRHTDAIVTSDEAAAARFLSEIDSAIVLHNASTQFADGGEFGFGAEIGIATGRMHARGPVGLEQLTTFKYVVRGEGQVRR